MNRRRFGLAGAAWASGLLTRRGAADDLLAAPVGGNPQGPLTVVGFFDYNCPYCKRASPVLEAFAAQDPDVRLVYKDWPILGEASVAAARLALAALVQDRYAVAHRALMALAGHRSTADRMRAAVAEAGLDLARLDANAQARGAAIQGLLTATAGEATGLGLNAVPAIFVGGFQVRGGFDTENFEAFAARARAARHQGGFRDP